MYCWAHKRDPNIVFVSEKTVQVSCVARSSVELPCNLTSPLKDDQVRLVLWFKNDSAKPIYTYDTRGTHSTPASTISCVYLGCTQQLNDVLIFREELHQCETLVRWRCSRGSSILQRRQQPRPPGAGQHQPAGPGLVQVQGGLRHGAHQDQQRPPGCDCSSGETKNIWWSPQGSETEAGTLQSRRYCYHHLRGE